MYDANGLTRRHLLAIAAPLAAIPGHALAAVLSPTPRQSLGPFYPPTLPLDRDNDLTVVAGRSGRAAGVVTHVFGRLSDVDGRAVPGALIEIWQCNAFGRYHHPRAPANAPVDDDFQGYGQTVTDADGAYRFRTIRPVPYPGRTPHIHFAVQGPGFERLVTQMYVAGEPLNERDSLLNRVRDPAARARLIVPLEPAPDIEPDALAGTFDIVLGA
ncbi:MAG: protocatechuate 3,4-dioxygenase [Alphaproteobacteria bacterium]